MRWLPTVILLLVSVPAVAQVGDFFRNIGLSPEETDLAGAAAESLYTQRGVRTGQTATWKSTTGPATGSVEITGVTEGGRCVSIRHRIQPRPEAPVQPIDFRRCNDGQGNWILAP